MQDTDPSSPLPAPRRTLAGDVRRLLKVASVLTVIALFIGGAGPGVLLRLLGLDDAIGLVGSIISTAPLSLTAGAVIIALSRYRDTVGLRDIVAGLAVAAVVSLLAALVMGQLSPDQWPQTPKLPGGIEVILGPPIFVAQTLGVFLGVYGWARFVLALAGAVFLYYAYTLVLLPRLSRPSAGPGTSAGP
jgi:hypothetical protein